MDKFQMQDDEYIFPYHYIPIYENNTFKRGRILWWGGEYLAYMKFISEKIIKDNAKTVLDVGCGDGRFCNFLNSYNYFKRIKGLDLSKKAIEWAKLFNPSLEFEAKDVAMEDETWDAIAVIEVIEHIPDEQIDKFFQNIYRVLKDDGKIYLTVPSKNLPFQKKHYRHYNIDMIQEHLDSADVALKIEESGYIVPKGDKFDRFMQMIFYNKFWKFEFFDKFEWKRLWRNGLKASDTTGTHCYAVLTKDR